MTKHNGGGQILEAVHETAGDLHTLGFITKRKMAKYDSLCLEPVPEYDQDQIDFSENHMLRAGCLRDSHTKQ